MLIFLDCVPMRISYHQYYLRISMFVFIISISFFYKVSTENGIRERGLSVVLYVGKMSIQIFVSLNRSNPVAFKQPGAF